MSSMLPSHTSPYSRLSVPVLVKKAWVGFDAATFYPALRMLLCATVEAVNDTLV